MGTPSGQYNGQLRPLMNTTIKGAIWYQVSPAAALQTFRVLAVHHNYRTIGLATDSVN